MLTALLNWLGETPAQRASPTGTPGYLSFGMAGKNKKVFARVPQSVSIEANEFE